MKTKEMLIKLLNSPTKKFRHYSKNKINKSIVYNYRAQILNGQLEIIDQLSGNYVACLDLNKEWIEIEE